MKKLLSVLFLLSFTLASVYAQDIQVKGTVVSGSDNEPLPGVNVVVKGTTTGSITDIEGNFTLSVPSDAVLSVSYIGYTSQDVPVNGKRDFRIVLQEDWESLDEVVVIGYGVQKKSVVTAAISRITAEDLNIAKPSRVEDALKGKITGVQITQSSGQPGADSKVRIRGIGTVNNSDPLYIVDGMAINGGINYLNPVDIESVEVLKDAASAAVFGTRGANGVILITTKSGKSGKVSINYDVSYGWQNPWKKKSVLDATEYMTIMNEMDVNDGNAPRYAKDQIAQAGKGTDWQDETFNYDAPIQQHQVSASGGNEKVQYFLSLGYFNQEGIVGGNYGKSNYERWSLRTNSTYTVFEDNSRSFLNKLKVGANISYSRGVSTGIETNSEYGSILGSAIAFSPLVPVYASKEEGESILRDYPTAIRDKAGNVFSLPPTGYQELANPVAMLNSPDLTTNNEDKFVGSFFAELDIVKGLKLKSSYGADLAFWGSDGYGFEYYMGSMKKNEQSWVSSSMNRGMRWQVENILTYTNTFAEKHNLTVVLGQSASKSFGRSLSGRDFDLLETDPLKANINSAIADRDLERMDGATNGDVNLEALASYFGRLSYDYNERYMVQFTLRRDGSSHFGTNNKWATFPAVSMGWNIWNEPYLENVKPDWFDSFKLRFSWGKNGNESIGNLLYVSLMDGGQNYYYGGGYVVANEGKTGSMQYGASPGRLANTSIRWEESEQIDLGFDARFFNNALILGFDYFKKKTNGMLEYKPIPDYVGQSPPMSNLGDMENWGLEFELGWKHTVRDFSFDIKANASYMQNKLVDIGVASGEKNYEGAGASGVGDYVHGKNGEVWPYFYGMKTDGLFQNQDEIDAYVNKDGVKMQPEASPGDVRFVDFNKDGKVDDSDRTKIGKGMPDWTFGLTLGADYKGFDINLFFQGTVGNDVYDFAQRGDIPAMNRPTWILDRWHGEGTSNTIPRMTSSNPNKNWRSSDLYVKDGSYVRLKTAQLGYTLPATLTRKFSVQRLRVYVSAENLLTFTRFEGFDPELAAGGYTTMGVDKGIYPQSRTISIGANIVF
ncbi:SusC/RagA family TonB-linked outer membrane protein [Bacteroides sp. UBA939]|uniref:SusC/RagA family TonB-linked outer membrane protein n=1 Tax=Bacteroides sp. UBA939 TaxID=1946092 RepID=UPI0025B9C25F|nr:TonB-dependent receptor [Bacteroides sp. UBA939]